MLGTISTRGRLRGLGLLLKETLSHTQTVEPAPKVQCPHCGKNSASASHVASCVTAARATAAHAAAAQARLDKSSRLRRVSASLSHRRASLLQSETVRLAQAGDWGRLGQNGASATKKGMATVTTEARNRHSVRLQYAHVHVHVHVHNVIQHAHSVRRRRHECTHLLRESAA